MTYVLGLDIGSNSIGWAIATPEAILKLGSRIFPEGVDAKSREPKNRARREKRLLRRQIARKAQRRQTILRAFQILGWLPQDENELEKLWREDPYALRKTALDAPLSKSQLARVFFHLAKHRGFKSNRRTDPDDIAIVDIAGAESDGKAKKKNPLRDGAEGNQGYGEIDQLLKEGKFRTIGEYLASLNPHEVRIRARYLLRQHCEDEFEKICDAQLATHPELAAPVPETLLSQLCSRKWQTAWKKKPDPSLRAFIKSHLIFFQRPLKSQKHAVGKCSLEPTLRRAPISSLAFQTYRIWTTLATIELLKPERRFLTPDEKARAAQLLEKTKEMEIGKLLEKIGLGATVSCNYAPDKKIKGNDTAVQMMTMFRETTGKPSKKEQDAMAEKWNALPEAEKERRWKIIYDATDNEWLRRYGKEKWNLTDAGADALTKIRFKQGYASLSQRAMKKLIPFLKQGYNYAESCLKAGYHHSDKRPTQLSDKLGEVPNLRNPIVQQGLFELRRVVNAIIKEYGKPEEIHIEFARELKLPKAKREEIEKENEKRRKENEAFLEEIRELGVLNPTSNDIVKYRLWKECNGVCPYTGEQISVETLFQSGVVDIEHILPYSRSQDDSFNNLTLCFADFNQQKKKDLSPFEMKDRAIISEAEYQLMLDRVEKFRNKAKLRRFTQKEIKTEDFVARQLNDTAYLAREAKKYLETICPNIVVSNGQATAKLRNLWGLNALLHPLDKNRQEATLADLEANAEKNRRDNRHHALDAAVIAMTTPAIVHKLSSYSKYKRKATRERFPLPFPDFREQLKAELDELLVSRYQKDRLQGALHEDTFYGAVRERDGSHKEIGGYKLYAIRKPVTALTGNMIEEIADKEIRKAFQDLVESLKAEGVTFKEGSKPLPKEFYEAAKRLKMPIKRVNIEGRRVSAKTLTPRDLQRIEPPFIRALFEKRLQDFPNLAPNEPLPDAFFQNFGIPIKSVRIHQKSAARRELRPRVFIETGNNHHIEIFREIGSKTGKAKYVGRIVTLLDAVTRKRLKQPVIDKSWDGREFIMSLMIDEMVLISEGDFKVEKIDWSNPDYKTISKHLYRVQKMTGNQIFFCHHLDSTLDRSISKTPNTLRAIKVKVNALGKIKPVSEPMV
ncbi:MAG: type II CRISPR RNA-guided endonuclease Cas9 [Chloroherpetonaceae bacterium]|nr:type II CRISPR RNA-guided endonuclease Cas9 [Chloroherpetonaceae bacterium]